MWPSLGFLSLSRSEFHRENRKPRTFPFPSLPLFFSLLLYLTILFLIKKDLSFYPFLSHYSFPSTLLPLFLIDLCFLWLVRILSISSLAMKKAKGAATAYAMDSSPPFAYKDPKTSFKHQTLLQDFEELYKEIEAKKKRLQMMRKKKMMLSGEVRFLRGRYKYLTQNQSHNPLSQQNIVLPQNVVNRSRKERSYNGGDANLLCAVPRFDLNQKGKIYTEKELTQRSPAHHVFDLNQKQKTYIRKEAALHNSAAIPDLNHKESIYTGKEATVRSNSPIFDLNQISREEEEFEANNGVIRIDEPKMFPVRVGSDEQHNDMKLSACRNVGNASSRAGKRKITWQDQMALRV